MTQAIKLKKDFEIAVSSIQDHIKNLSKNKLLKSQIEEMQQTLIKDDNPKFGFADSSKRENIIASEKNYDELKDQHQKDIEHQNKSELILIIFRKSSF